MVILSLLLACATHQGATSEPSTGHLYVPLAVNLPRICVSQVPAAGKLPDKGSAWTAGVAALQSGDTELAAAKLQGDHPGFGSARAALDLASGRTEDGRTALRDLANAWPDDACLQQAAGLAYFQSGKLKSGNGFVKAAVRLDPTQPDNHLLDGLTRAWQGDRDGANRAYRATLTRSPHHPLASALLGRDAVAIGDAAGAIPYLEDALAGGLDVADQLPPAYFAAGHLNDYLRVASAAGWPLGDAGALATAADPEAALGELLGVVDDQLMVELVTSMGTLTCELFWRDTPVTVANFVGLARGTQPWTDPTTKEPGVGSLYNGSVMHRVIPDFMVQMGDPTGTGSGDPGYRFADEFVSSIRFDKGGMLGMANNGANRNGSQFFVTEKAVPHLDGKHTIFGECSKESLGVVKAIARVQTRGMDKPVIDVVLETVRVVAP
jgi:cyclophilin family peptidyl-prolyl cis-trans isomerase